MNEKNQFVGKYKRNFSISDSDNLEKLELQIKEFLNSCSEIKQLLREETESNEAPLPRQEPSD